MRTFHVNISALEQLDGLDRRVPQDLRGWRIQVTSPSGPVEPIFGDTGTFSVLAEGRLAISIRPPRTAERDSSRVFVSTLGDGLELVWPPAFPEPRQETQGAPLTLEVAFARPWSARDQLVVGGPGGVAEFHRGLVLPEGALRAEGLAVSPDVWLPGNTDDLLVGRLSPLVSAQATTRILTELGVVRRTQLGRPGAAVHVALQPVPRAPHPTPWDAGPCRDRTHSVCVAGVLVPTRTQSRRRSAWASGYPTFRVFEHFTAEPSGAIALPDLTPPDGYEFSYTAEACDARYTRLGTALSVGPTARPRALTLGPARELSIGSRVVAGDVDDLEGLGRLEWSPPEAGVASGYELQVGHGSWVLYAFTDEPRVTLPVELFDDLPVSHVELMVRRDAEVGGPLRPFELTSGEATFRRIWLRGRPEAPRPEPSESMP
jgi:hypothetical protein